MIAPYEIAMVIGFRLAALILLLALVACGSADGDIALVCEKECSPSGAPTAGNYGPVEKR